LVAFIISTTQVVEKDSMSTFQPLIIPYLNWPVQLLRSPFTICHKLYIYAYNYGYMKAPDYQVVRTLHVSPVFFTYFKTWDLGFVNASSNSVHLTINNWSRAELTIQRDCSFVYLSVLLLLFTNWQGKNHTIWKFYFYFVLFLK
jgi:hypothetical protein